MKIKTSILTLSIAAFGFAVAVPQADATPNNKVPGDGYHKHRVDPTGHPAPSRKEGKKSYAQKKIGI